MVRADVPRRPAAGGRVRPLGAQARRPVPQGLDRAGLGAHDGDAAHVQLARVVRPAARVRRLAKTITRTNIAPQLGAKGLFYAWTCPATHLRSHQVASILEELGLSNDWAYNILMQVGNYGESYEANVTPLGLARGVNALWSDGGILYAAPIR